MSATGDSDEDDRCCIVLHQTADLSRSFVVRCASGEFVTFHEEHNDFVSKKDGRKEISPEHMISNAISCIQRSLDNYLALKPLPNKLISLSLCTQSNILIAWSRSSGRSLYSALVEDDPRCDEMCQKLIQKSWRKSITFHHLCGLPLSARWAGVKLKWLLDNISLVQEAHKEGDLMVGTLDSWLLWNLSGGTSYSTDVTNASNTMLMNLHRSSWDSVICKFLDIDSSILPEIKSSVELYGSVTMSSPSVLEGLPITGVMNDIKASIIGHQGTQAGSVSLHIDPGSNCSKLAIVVGEEPVFYRSMLKGVGYLTSTVCCQLGPKENTVYALEATIYNSQNVLSWLRHGVHFVSSTDDIDTVVNSVPDSGGCYFIPTMSSNHNNLCLSPYRHVNIWGVNLLTTKSGHIVRAALESVAVEVSQVLSAIATVVNIPFGIIHITGRDLAHSDAFCQLIADFSGLKVDRLAMSESVIVGGSLLAVLGNNMDPSGLRGSLKDAFSCLMVPGERKIRCKRWENLATEQELLDHRFWIGSDDADFMNLVDSPWNLQSRNKKYLTSRQNTWGRRLLSMLVIGTPFTLLGFGAALLLSTARLNSLKFLR